MGKSDCSAWWCPQNTIVYVDPNLWFLTEFTDLSSWSDNQSIANLQTETLQGLQTPEQLQAKRFWNA